MSEEITLPGFRFHPTDEELVDFYLKNMVANKLRYDIIGFLNIYHHDPWNLPGLSKVGEREWYFFVPRDKKHGSGGRPNRTTEKGFWKATGSDRRIVTLSDPKRIIGLKKTLVFYEGRAPRGNKTDWIMNEYRLPDTCNLPKEIVLCKIYRKATSLKVLEQRAALEEEIKQLVSSPTNSMDTMSFIEDQNMLQQHVILKKESEGNEEMLSVPMQENTRTQMPIIENKNKMTCGTLLQLPLGNDKLPELQLPMMITDWTQLTQDNFWAQLNSPWLQNFTPSYSNILNF
ncbi:hypothetical protein TanjilG_23395 [Lupinus angustifolius]|uniref:NAC domain-containing protein n=1 Tax=Lupinus angustifolius TaxID=3871 RepID=A0A4P1R934_LUPAN|nr:PREDICTED: NAC domain-containing protein 35-like [Lupinus angustifolius]OIW05609.1 hypothetical protein TanjilG_23395 [Lupinus angustifolius]